MACGSNLIKTIVAIGHIPSETILDLANRDNVRVLHFLETAGDLVMPESASYKMITGDIFDRIFVMALFMQYDASIILVSNDLLSETLYTVCQEQWEGEYDKRSLVLFNDEAAFSIDVSTSIKESTPTLIESFESFFADKVL